MKKIKDFSIGNIRIFKFSARKVFGVDTSACLLMMQTSNVSKNTAIVYELDNPKKPLYQMGYIGNKFYTKIGESVGDGIFFKEWHSGVKHDLKDIMELEKIGNNMYQNGKGEIVELEDEYIYPLLKSSDLKNQGTKRESKYVIITQTHTNENTTKIEQNAPKLWNYLKNNEKYFIQRKSKIYKNKPQFSMFGIGPYCFKEYKVAVSSFYIKPTFIFVSSEKPTFFDDTCYFISFDKEYEAIITCILLNSLECKEMISTMSAEESKRVITKEILMRINFITLIEHYDYKKMMEESKIYTRKRITKKEYNTFKKLILDAN